MPFQPLDYKLGLRRPQRHKYRVRYIRTREMSCQSQSPEATRCGLRPPRKFDEIRPVKPAPLDYRRAVTECPPASPLHCVRPCKVDAHVPQLVGRMGNQERTTLCRHSLGARPERIGRKAKRMLFRKDVVVYFQPKSTGLAQKSGKVLVAAESFRLGVRFRRCPAVRLKQRPGALGMVRPDEHIEVAHGSVGERRKHGVPSPAPLRRITSISCWPRMSVGWCSSSSGCNVWLVDIV